MTKGKPSPEPGPIDGMKERQDMIEDASNQFLAMVVEFAEERELSAVEIFAIVSKAMYSLSETALQHEHEEYFGPGAEDEGEES